jgi:hypothetical protein
MTIPTGRVNSSLRPDTRVGRAHTDCAHAAKYPDQITLLIDAENLSFRQNRQFDGLASGTLLDNRLYL